MVKKTLSIPSDRPTAREVVNQVVEEVAEELESQGAVESDIQSARFKILMTLEEGVINHIKHGNHDKLEKKVHIAYEVTEDRLKWTSRDEGEGFDPASLPDPTADENLEIPNGRGVMIMREMTSDHGGSIDYPEEDGGRTLVIDMALTEQSTANDEIEA